MEDQQFVAVVDQVGQLEINSTATNENETQHSSKETRTVFIEASCVAKGGSDVIWRGSPDAEMHNENLNEKEKKKQMNAIRWYVNCNILKVTREWSTNTQNRRRWWEKNRTIYNMKRRVAFKKANASVHEIPDPLVPQATRCLKRTASGGQMIGAASVRLVTMEQANNHTVQKVPIQQPILQTTMNPSRIAVLSPTSLVAPSLPAVVGPMVYMTAPPPVGPGTPALRTNSPLSIGRHSNTQVSSQVPFHVVPLSGNQVAGDQQTTPACVWVNVQSEPSVIVSNTLPFTSPIAPLIAVRPRPGELVWAPELAFAMRSTQ